MKNETLSESRRKDLSREMALAESQEHIPQGSYGLISDDDLKAVAHRVRTGLPWIPDGFHL